MRNPNGDTGRARLVDRPPGYPGHWQALASFRVGNGWDHVAFREYVLAAASKIPDVTTQADIARAAGVGQSNLSKWFRGQQQPEVANLRAMQAGFARHGVQVRLIDLARLAGRAFDDDGAEPGEPVATVAHPLARELDQFLADDSPIPQADRDALATVLNGVFEPYRKRMRRRRSA